MLGETTVRTFLWIQTDAPNSGRKVGISEQRSKKNKPQVGRPQVPDKGNTEKQGTTVQNLLENSMCVSSVWQMTYCRYLKHEKFLEMYGFGEPLFHSRLYTKVCKQREREKLLPEALTVRFLLTLLGVSKIQITQQGALPSPVALPDVRIL